MNRYSLFFAMMVAATFVAPSPNPVDTSSPAATVNKAHGPDNGKHLGIDPGSALQEFLDKRLHPAEKTAPGVQVLFATVPHPIETHLASDFDEDVAALEEAIQDSDYYFDSAWIPWEATREYEHFNDEIDRKAATEYEDGFPGILLFRKKVPPNTLHPQEFDAYGHGLVVFLIAEKPTAGLEVGQVEEALQILKSGKVKVSLPDLIRISGPTFSGSLSSLVAALTILHKEKLKANFLIRSSVSGGNESQKVMAQASLQMPDIRIDFGSMERDHPQWTALATSRLAEMGIEAKHVAFLSEDESLYGTLASTGQIWHIPFPRDISSLRVGYSEQGVLDSNSSSQPWKHFLNLKSNEASDGDTVRSFGGISTLAAQESILFGISEFLRTHAIRAVIISATNQADTYFLSQFFHANNSAVRIISVNSTRLFLRGATSQFRGDLVLDEFPMLPRLHDWTVDNPATVVEGEDDLAYDQHIFATGSAQSAYIAAIDLMSEPRTLPNKSGAYPEYSTPAWKRGTPDLRPPMYLTSLGGDSPWPVALENDTPISSGTMKSCTDKPSAQAPGWHVEMPVTLFSHMCLPTSTQQVQSKPPALTHFWVMLFLVLWFLVLLYCFCFFYADPITRRFCASFEPIREWRYWLFAVFLPALLAGLAFGVLASPVQVQAAVFENVALGWWLAGFSSFLAPLALSLSALLKAKSSPDQKWHPWKTISLLPALLTGVFTCSGGFEFSGEPYSQKISTLLNAYREMHWESGLSLIPTWLLLLFAFFLWARQGRYANALMSITPKLPTFQADQRISKLRGESIETFARPMPSFDTAPGLWRVWLTGVVLLVLVVRFFPSFNAVTTLESEGVTRWILWSIAALAALMLLDLMQFLLLWNQLNNLLRALDTCIFKRSFVPIDGFKWPGIWSFGGVSFYDRKAVLSAQIECVASLKDAFPEDHPVIEIINRLTALRLEYRTSSLAGMSVKKYRLDLIGVFDDMSLIGDAVAVKMESDDYPLPQKFSPKLEALRRTFSDKCKEPDSRFADEAEDVARLLEWQQCSERFICLLYIGFVQTMIARLHGLMISVASVFSSVALAIAIYPFAPMSPFFLGGLTLLPIIAWAFFHVFSLMDTDPVLSRIVNGDDRKLEWNFYGKFAESLALPVLTLVSSLLPGGVGRVLDVARTVLTHSQ